MSFLTTTFFVLIAESLTTNGKTKKSATKETATDFACLTQLWIICND